MGCLCSKNSGKSAPPTPPPPTPPPPPLLSRRSSIPPPPTDPPPPIFPKCRVKPDLSSYVTACLADPDVKSFDSTLQERTGRVILAVGGDVQSLSLDSLGEVTAFYLEMNQEVSKVILDSDEDIWKDQELRNLVKEYVDHSQKTLEFCNALEDCVKLARERQYIVQLALRKFEEEQKEASSGEKPSYSRTLQELKNLKAGGNSFTQKLVSFTRLQYVYTQQSSLLNKLQTQKNKLDHKLNSVKAWSKVFYVIFAASFASILICSVVAAAITAPPVVSALAAAAMAAHESMGRWFDSIWRTYESEITGKNEMIRSLKIRYIPIKDMDNIGVLVEKVEIEMEALLKNADLAMEEGVVIAMGEIKKKVNGFIQSIDDLCEHSDKLIGGLTRQRTVIISRVSSSQFNHMKKNPMSETISKS